MPIRVTRTTRRCTPEGPYGFDPASAEFDSMVQDTIKRGNLDQFLSADLDFADRAKVDGLWQVVMLAGALHHTPMRGELLSYEVPSYFGMLVAAYQCRVMLSQLSRFLGFAQFRHSALNSPGSRL